MFHGETSGKRLGKKLALFFLIRRTSLTVGERYNEILLETGLFIVSAVCS